MASLNSSVQIQFVSVDETGSLRWEKDEERKTDQVHQVYLRLYPDAADRVEATSGSLSKLGLDYSQEETTVVFTGTREVSIGQKGISEVKLNQVGAFFDTSGNSIQANIRYDPARNTVQSDQPCYGVVNVSYKASYRLYLFTFSGSPCQYKYIDGQGVVMTGGWNPATIIAINFDSGASATINLTPPSCDGQFLVSAEDDMELPRLKIEVHQNHPPKLIKSRLNPNKISAGCKLRITPSRITPMVLSSSGTVLEEGDVDHEPVIDAITFSGTSSKNMSYQPDGLVDITFDSARFFDAWGRSIIPAFAQPGETITEVDWEDGQHYKNPRPRVVGADELVSIDSAGRAIPIYGSIQARYTVSYKQYGFEFDRAGEKLEDGFQQAHIIAFYDNQAAYLSISPPTMKE